VKIVVPATPGGLHHSVIPAILRQGGAPIVWPVGPGEEYFELIRLLWAAGRDFVIVEHDVEIPPGALAGFVVCPSPWCAHSYEVYAGDVATAYGGPYALGLARFRAELMAAHPEAVEEAGKMNLHPKHPPRSYAVMDSTLTRWLRGPCRREPCQHFPNALHHHAYNRTGAYVPS